MWRHIQMQKIYFIVLFTTLLQIHIAKLGECLKIWKKLGIELEVQINAWVIWVYFYVFREKIMFKNH